MTDAWLTTHCESGFVFTVPVLGGSSYYLLLKGLVTTWVIQNWHHHPGLLHQGHRQPRVQVQLYPAQHYTPGGHMLGWDHQRKTDPVT